MTYRCGIAPNMALLGFTPGPPQIRCDEPGCSAKVVLRDDRPPPAWFLDGKAPPRWRIVRDGDTRHDYCPLHKDRP